MTSSRPDPGSHRPRGPIRLGLKRRILLVLVGVLVLTAALQALLASYFTNRQNEVSAYAVLGRDLDAWKNDLQEATLHLRAAALAAVGDAVVLNQLAELETLELDLGDPTRAAESADLARTQGYAKAVSLHRLQLVLRTSGFSSIAVYHGAQLSHLITDTGAGMLVRRRGTPVWVVAPTDSGGRLPLDSWPAWGAAPIPAAGSGPVPALRATAVSFESPAPDSTVIQVAGPIEGVIQVLHPDVERQATVRFVAELGIGGLATGARRTVAGRREVFAVVVFRKKIDRVALGRVAERSGKWPALFSPDGAHAQQLLPFGLSRSELLERLDTTDARMPGGRHQGQITAGGSSWYLALDRWQFEGRPGLILAMATSREVTLENIRETVTALVGAAAVLLMLGILIGTIAVGRFVNPTVALTRAVQAIVLPGPTDDGDGTGGRIARDRLTPIALQAPDEVGDLADAFNTLVAELRQSFETLEQRVQARTSELRQQTRYLRTLIDTLPMWAWLKDTDGRYLAANQATAAACGRSPEDMVGRSDRDCWPAELAAAYRADDEEVMASRQRKTVEERLADVRGAVWIETYKAPVLDEDDSVLGTVGVARNISERKAAEAAREAALAEAERLARLRSEFLAQMSHELRTPLNSILGYAQILQQDQALGERQAAGVAIIRQSGEHLLALINDVLDFAKIEAGRLELSFSDVPLPAFLATITNAIQVKADQKRLEFRLEAEPALPRVIRVDERRLRQVLLNLMDNAVKFTDRGRVTLRVRVRPGARLLFEVEDSGIGIPADRLAAIFRPFEQVGDVHRRVGGTGLGLPISQEVLRLMGSEIHVESQVGVGSIFRFELDAPEVALAGRETEHHSQSTIGYRGPRRRLLVVDDIAENRAVLAGMLTPLGFDVVEADAGGSGVASAEATRPDMVLMDIVMPGMDGLAAIRAIRQLAGLGQVPIIAVSASASSGDEERSLAEGANAFLPKPVDRDRLLRLVGRFLELEWVQSHPEPRADPAADATPLLAPPAEELEQLHVLAREGNMRDILSWATRLSERDARYRPFCDRLRGMANGYQSRAILRFVEQHRLPRQDA